MLFDSHVLMFWIIAFLSRYYPNNQQDDNYDFCCLSITFSLVNGKLKGFSPVLDATGKITGYTTEIGGAGTVFPFSSEITIPFDLYTDANNISYIRIPTIRYSLSVTFTLRNGKHAFVGQNGYSVTISKDTFTFENVKDTFGEYVEIHKYKGNSTVGYNTHLAGTFTI